jgi:hypothetical protein
MNVSSISHQRDGVDINDRVLFKVNELKNLFENKRIFTTSTNFTKRISIIKKLIIPTLSDCRCKLRYYYYEENLWAIAY